MFSHCHISKVTLKNKTKQTKKTHTLGKAKRKLSGKLCCHTRRVNLMWIDAVVPYLVLQFNTTTRPYSFARSTTCAGNWSVWPSPALQQKLQRNLYFQQGAVPVFPLVFRSEQSNTPHHVVCCHSTNESSCCNTKDWQEVFGFCFFCCPPTW